MIRRQVDLVQQFRPEHRRRGEQLVVAGEVEQRLVELHRPQRRTGLVREGAQRVRLNLRRDTRPVGAESLHAAGADVRGFLPELERLGVHEVRPATGQVHGRFDSCCQQTGGPHGHVQPVGGAKRRVAGGVRLVHLAENRTPLRRVHARHVQHVGQLRKQRLEVEPCVAVEAHVHQVGNHLRVEAGFDQRVAHVLVDRVVAQLGGVHRAHPAFTGHRRVLQPVQRRHRPLGHGIHPRLHFGIEGAVKVGAGDGLEIGGERLLRSVLQRVQTPYLLRGHVQTTRIDALLNERVALRYPVEHRQRRALLRDRRPCLLRDVVHRYLLAFRHLVAVPVPPA